MILSSRKLSTLLRILNNTTIAAKIQRNIHKILQKNSTLVSTQLRIMLVQVTMRINVHICTNILQWNDVIQTAAPTTGRYQSTVKKGCIFAM